MDKRKLSNMLLILTALIWGSAFVAQSIGMEYIGPFTFGAARSILGGVTLLPVVFFRKKKSQANKGKAEPDEKKEKNEIKYINIKRINQTTKTIKKIRKHIFKTS